MVLMLFFWLPLAENTMKNTFIRDNYHFTIFGCQFHYVKINSLWIYFYIVLKKKVKIFFLYTFLFLNRF